MSRRETKAEMEKDLSALRAEVIALRAVVADVGLQAHARRLTVALQDAGKVRRCAHYGKRGRCGSRGRSYFCRKHRPKKRQLPGSRWRVKADFVHSRFVKPALDTDQDDVTVMVGGKPVFPVVLDEVVVDDWLHLEQMDEWSWCLIVGDLTVWIRIAGNGRAIITDMEARVP